MIADEGHIVVYDGALVGGGVSTSSRKIAQTYITRAGGVVMEGVVSKNGVGVACGVGEKRLPTKSVVT